MHAILEVLVVSASFVYFVLDRDGRRMMDSIYIVYESQEYICSKPTPLYCKVVLQQIS